MISPQALQDLDLTWAFDSKSIICPESYNYDFFCPFPKAAVSSVVDKYIKKLAASQIIGQLRKYGVTEEKLKNSISIEFSISKTLLVNSYLQVIKKALECFMGGVKVSDIAGVKFLSDTRLLVGLDDAAGEKLTAFVNDSNDREAFEGVADYLDIWGSKLNDTRYLFEILVHLGVAELSGVNFHEADEFQMKKIADIDTYGDSFGYIARELPQVALIDIVGVSV